MTLTDIARKLLPTKVRIKIGVWAINQASRSWPTLKTYLSIIRGSVPKGLGLDKDGCAYIHNGHRIVAPKNAAGVFLEIFEDEVYEKAFSPMKGDTVIDVGAYVGMFTIKASHLVGNAGKVIAVEPSPENYMLLDENCGDIQNIRKVKKALSNKEGYGKLYYSRSPAANSLVIPWESYTLVKLTTLDILVKRLDLERVDFIKIDAEGAEMKVLQGAEEILQGNVKLSIASYHTSPNGEPEAPKVIEFLKARGFHIQTDSGLRRYIYAKKQAKG